MDIATLNSTLSGVGVIAALLFIVAVVLIVQRTGSTHVITHRLWRWATDRQNVKDERTQAFLDEQHGIMAFRFISGLSVRSVDQTHTLIDYLKTNGVDISDVRVSSAYLDETGRGIELKSAPPKGMRWIQFGVAVILVWAMLTALGARLIAHDGWLWFKLTDTLFLLSAEQAKRWGDFRPLTAEQCNTVQPGRGPGFEAEEARSLCKLLTQPAELKILYTNTVAGQKSMLTILAGICAFFAWRLVAAMERGQAAIRVQRALGRPTQGERLHGDDHHG